MQSIRYTITDPLGIHARPAGILVKKCATYDSTISIKRTDTGKTADAKRIIGVMSLGAKKGDEIELSFDGTDEEAAKAAIEELLSQNF